MNHNEQKTSKWLRWPRFSIRALLGVTIVAALFTVVFILPPIHEARTVEKFKGPQVKGIVNEFRPRFAARFTPHFVQQLVGPELFQTVQSAYVFLYIDESERNKYHRQQSPELAIRCISEFKNLHHLDLRFSASQPDLTIDLSPLKQCKRIHQIEICRPNGKIVQSLCDHVEFNCLTLTDFKLDNDTIESILKNRSIESIQITMCDVSSQHLLAFKRKSNLKQVHFQSCLATNNPDGSFSFGKKALSSAIVLITPEEQQRNTQAKKWLQRELTGVTISGL